MDYLHSTQMTIPVFEVVVLLAISTVVLLFGRTKLALLINYLFTLRWGYFSFTKTMFGSEIYFPDSTFLLCYFTFGFLVALLAGIGFFYTS